MSEHGPKTPKPARIRLVDPGPEFASLPTPDRLAITYPLDEIVRPTVLALAQALAKNVGANRTIRIGLRRRIEAIRDGELIPCTSKLPGAKPLTREQWLSIFDTLDWADREQFGRNQQDLYALVCGATSF